MAKAKVSIILPTYNRAHTLGSSLESVLKQTYPWFEIILVDDGSKDNTRALVESYGDERIRYYYARNYGLERAECDYIGFQDSDDVWRSDKLEKQMRVLEEADVGMVYHKIAYDFGEGRYAILPSEQIPLEKKSGYIYEQMLYDNLIPCPSIVAKRDVIEKAGGFDTELKALEDYDFALKLAKGCKVQFIDEVLLDAAYSQSGVSGDAVNYLLASCRLIQKYKEDYLKTDPFNHRIEVILRDSQAIGMQDQFVQLLEKMLQE